MFQHNIVLPRNNRLTVQGTRVLRFTITQLIALLYSFENVSFIDKRILVINREIKDRVKKVIKGPAGNVRSKEMQVCVKGNEHNPWVYVILLP